MKPRISRFRQIATEAALLEGEHYSESIEIRRIAKMASRETGERREELLALATARLQALQRGCM